MSGLTLSANIARPDDFYARLLSLHEGLDAQESRVVNARLILILANHIGDESLLSEALELAGHRAGARAAA
jgi:hypothetical protein